ncbi:hypothetical protein [Nonomuraea sp. JJY05]|jgi:hypothetical protein|uniref:hypothetical protein n=1 Tax=Nonomuraea sp. JJY05 TaxID=3350255 RepID=UPI00373E328E
MRRRAHLLATAALLTALAPAVVLSPAGLTSEFPTISQRLINSLVLTNGYVSQVSDMLGDSLGSLNLHV